MAKWVTWVQGGVKEEGEKHYGEGPFMVTGETDDDLFLLIPFKMKKDWFQATTPQVNTERRYASLLEPSGEHRCEGSCKEKKKEHPLAGLQVTVDPKHVEQSPFTKQFHIGQKVITPQGPGVVSEVRWKQVAVGKFLYDYAHVRPKKD